MACNHGALLFSHTFKFVFKRTYCLKKFGVTDPKFSSSEQEKILSTVNGSSADQLSKYNVSAARIKSLSAYRNKNGPFQSLNEILEVDGLGIKAFQKICEDIIQDRVTLLPTKKPANGLANKRHKNLLTPSIPEDKLSSIMSAVGLHLGPTGASWAKLNKDQNRLEKWGYENFMSLPPKMLPTDTYNLALSILEKIPISDVYIFESSSKNMQGQNQSIVTSQHLELTSMLLALLNTSSTHNLWFQSQIAKDVEMPKVVFPNVVYFVKYNLPARLFKTFIGNERVSTVNIVTELLTSSALPMECQLPCSKISLEPNLINEYTSKSPPEKELLGQALMLAITFMDIWVYKNTVSITEVTSHSSKKK